MSSSTKDNDNNNNNGRQQRLDRSYFPVDDGYLDKIDKQFSAFVFTCAVGPFIELPLSVFGTCFGNPLTALVLYPMIIATVADYCANHNDTTQSNYLQRTNTSQTSGDGDGDGDDSHYWRGILFTALTCTYGIVYLWYWFYLLFSPNHSSNEIYTVVGKRGLIILILSVQIVTHVVLGPASTAAALGSYYVCLHLLAQIPVLHLKSRTHRKRPGLSYSSTELHKVTRYFPDISYLTATGYTVFESFPSGDAAGGMIFSCVLALAVTSTSSNNSGNTTPSSSIILDDANEGSSTNTTITFIATTYWVYIFAITASFGRMYYWAHHLLDVIVGCLIPYCLNKMYITVSSAAASSSSSLSVNSSSSYSTITPPHQFTLYHVLVCMILFGTKLI